MEDLTGKQLGPYRVVASLGEGGMAAVYKAYQPGMDRYVALKILPRQLADDPQFAARFQQEAQVIARLQHPHILPVFDYGTDGEHTYIAMSFVKSGTLASLLEGRPLPFSQIKTFISQIGDALDYAHTQGIVHRDVKPGNVLLDERGNCLLTDFGIAKIVEASGAGKLTASGGVVGTPVYMSPEQGRGDKVDARSDIYSLGVILYEMATGRVPFNAETPIGIVFKHIEEPLPPPQPINPAITSQLEAVIQKALAKQPADRFASASEMVHALQVALADAPAASLSTLSAASIADRLPTRQPIPKPTSPVPSKAAFPWWALAVAGVLAVAVVVFVIAAVGGGVVLTSVSRSATQTAVAARPTSPPAVRFAEDDYGVLLVASDDQDARLLLGFLERDVKATLAETGVGSNVKLSTQVAASTESLEQIVGGSRARIGLSILVSRDAGQLSIGLQTHFAQPPETPLQAIADALSETLPSDSLSDASAALAERIGTIVNAAMGYDAWHAGQYDNCSRRFTAVLSLDKRLHVVSNRAEAAHLALGTCLSALDRAEEGRAEYEAAIAINPNYAAAYYSLGNYWYGKGDYDRARQLYEQTLQKAQIDPLSSDVIVGRAHAGLGNIALAQLRYDEAIKAFDEAIKNQPGFPAYYLARAMAKRGAGLDEEANGDLMTCIDLAKHSEAVQSDYFHQLEQNCTSMLEANP